MDPTQASGLQKIINDFTNAMAFFTTPQFIILCLIIAIIVMGFRKTIEFVSSMLSDKYNKYKNFVNSKSFVYFYTEIFVPAMPIITGGIFARIVTTYPYPEDFKVMGGRVSYGIIAGLLSAYVYPRIKYLFKQLQKTPPDSTNVVPNNVAVQEQEAIVNPLPPAVNPMAIKTLQSEEITKPDLKIEVKKEETK